MPFWPEQPLTPTNYHIGDWVLLDAVVDSIDASSVTEFSMSAYSGTCVVAPQPKPLRARMRCLSGIQRADEFYKGSPTNFIVD